MMESQDRRCSALWPWVLAFVSLCSTNCLRIGFDAPIAKNVDAAPPTIDLSAGVDSALDSGVDSVVDSLLDSKSVSPETAPPVMDATADGLVSVCHPAFSFSLAKPSVGAQMRVAVTISALPPRNLFSPWLTASSGSLSIRFAAVVVTSGQFVFEGVTLPKAGPWRIVLSGLTRPGDQSSRLDVATCQLQLLP